MADFMIAEAEWLARESSRVWSVLQVKMQHDTAYSAAELKAIIDDVGGFNYTAAEVVTIRDELKTQGKIVVV